MEKRGRPFAAGNQFGRGRPRGSRNKKTPLAQQLLNEHAEPLVRKALLEALKGDKTLMRTLLSYILPRQRDLPPKMGPLAMGTAEELAQSSAAILTEVRAGKITVHDAREMFQLFETQRRLIETQEFDARLRAAEQGNVPPGVQ
jgi:hypothetical protein